MIARDLTRDLLMKPSCGTQAPSQRGTALVNMDDTNVFVGLKRWLVHDAA